MNARTLTSPTIRTLFAAWAVAGVLPGLAAGLPPNSFIARPAPTHAELMRQVREDPVVRDRYRRHFALNGAALDAYVGGLRRGRLPASGLFAVYNVPRSGVLRSRQLRLSAGTPVWIDAAGRPILMVICGNPLTRGPQSPGDAGLAPTSEGDSTTVLRVVEPEPEPLFADATPALAPADPEVADGPVLVVLDGSAAETVPGPDAATAEAGPIEPAADPERAAMLVAPAAGFALTPLAWLLPAAGTAASVPTFWSRSAAPPRTEAVPEPATGLALAVGAGLLARRRRRPA